MIFDSHYDSFKGVVAYVRLMQGTINHQDDLNLMISGSTLRPVEIGTFCPQMTPQKSLTAGSVGYVATGLKTISEWPRR